MARIEETTANLKQHPSTVPAICLMSLSHGRYNAHDGRRRLYDDPFAVPRGAKFVTDDDGRAALGASANAAPARRLYPADARC